MVLKEGFYYVVEDRADPPPSTACWVGLFFVVPVSKNADVIELTDFGNVRRGDIEDMVADGSIVLKRVEKPDDIPSDV